MILTIVLTAIGTFIITALWSRWNQTKGMAGLFIFVTTIVNELNQLSVKLGSENIYEYWVKTNGKDYAEKSMMNIKKTIDFLSFKDASNISSNSSNKQ